MAKLAGRIITAFICTVVAACTSSVAMAAKSADLVSTDQAKVEIKNSHSESVDHSSSSQVKSSGDVLVSDKNDSSGTSASSQKTAPEPTIATADTASSQPTDLVNRTTAAPSAVQTMTTAKISPVDYQTASAQRLLTRRINTQAWPAAADTSSVQLNPSYTAPLESPSPPPLSKRSGQPGDLMLDLGGLLSMTAAAILPLPAARGSLLPPAAVGLKNSFGFLLVTVVAGGLAVIVLAQVISRWKRNRYRGAPRSDIADLAANLVGVIKKLQGSLAIARTPLFDERRYL